MSRYFRVFGFMGQVLGMIKSQPKLLSSLAINLGVATVVNVIFAIVYAVVGSDSAIGMIFLPLGLIALYFIDYFCAGMTVSLIHDQVTTQQVSLGAAFKRTLKSTFGILIFATVSGMIDWIASYARDRGGIVGSIILGIVRLVWTTATYVVMPAMVIEELGFFGAFKRSKELMKNDPTQVGIGVIGLELIVTLIWIVAMPIAYGLFQVFSGVPLLAMLSFYMMVNVFWSLSSYLRSTYYTCFYLWARECERQGRADPSLAPEPLREVVTPAFAGV